MTDASSLLSLLRAGGSSSSPSRTPTSAADSSAPQAAQQPSNPLLQLLNSQSSKQRQSTPPKVASPPPASTSSPSSLSSKSPAAAKPADASSLLMQLMGAGSSQQLSPPATALPPLSSPHLAPTTSADPAPLPPISSVLQKTKDQDDVTTSSRPSTASSSTTINKPQRRSSPPVQDPLKDVKVVQLSKMAKVDSVDARVEPVANFTSSPEFRRGRRVFGWDRALGWVIVKNGKIRLLSKTSASVQRLKGCDDAIDVSSAVSQHANKHVVAAISKSHLTICLVPSSWDDKSFAQETLVSVDLKDLVRVKCLDNLPLVAVLTKSELLVLPVSKMSDGDHLSKVSPVANDPRGDECIDLDVTSDGSSIAVLGTQSVQIWQTEHVSRIASFTLPNTLVNPRSVALVGPLVAVSFADGKTILFARKSESAWNPALALEAEAGTLMSKLSADALLLLSPSTGSVTSFALDAPEESSSKQADLFRKPTALDFDPHFSRFAVPRPLLDLCVTSSSLARQTDDHLVRKYEALAVSAEGLDEIFFSLSTSEKVREDEDEDEPGPHNDARRPSLADSIHVETEVSVDVDVLRSPEREAQASLEMMLEPPSFVKDSLSDRPKLKVAPVTDLADTSAATTPTPQQQASTSKEVKGDQQPALTATAETIADSKTIAAPQDVFGSPRLEAAHLSTSPGSTTSISPLALPANRPIVVDSRKTLLRQELHLGETEDDATEAIKTAIRAELTRYFQSSDGKRVETDASHSKELADSITKSVSQNVGKLVQTSVKKAVEEAVIPSVQKSLDAQVKAAVSDALGTVVTGEVERFLLKPQFAGTLVRNLSTALAPSMERTLSSVIANSIAPTFRTTLQQAVDQVVASVQQEMVGVRKEIVREQSGSLVKTEKGVASLQQEVQSLRSTLEQMQKTLAVMQRQAAKAPSQPAAPSSAQVSSTSTPAPVAQAAARLNGTSPPIVRSRQVSGPRSPQAQPATSRPNTPVELYEDLFTNALAAGTDPAWKSLVQLLDDSPSTRIDRVFPPLGITPGSLSSRKAHVSNAVRCSIAVRLSQALASGSTNLNDRERTWLNWIDRSQSAVDRKDTETAAQLPRVFEWIYSSLRSRETSLAGMRDLRGAAEVRVVASNTKAILEELKRA